jgi:isopropylmalate/homocitrate/citramalate synthase
VGVGRCAEKFPNRVIPQAISAERGGTCCRRGWQDERSDLGREQDRNTPTSHGNAAPTIGVAPTSVRDFGAARLRGRAHREPVDRAATAVSEATDLARRLIERARRDETQISVTLSVSFGCPFEGAVDPEKVLEIAKQVLRKGPDELVFADTIGVGVPAQVRELIGAVSDHETVIGCHFHDTRNTGIANAIAAVEAGATLLDASVGGTGGGPFAPRATGNIATEDLIYALDSMGFETGVDLKALIGCAEWLAGKLGKELPGRVYKAGAFEQVAG